VCDGAVPKVFPVEVHRFRGYFSNDVRIKIGCLLNVRIVEDSR